MSPYKNKPKNPQNKHKNRSKKTCLKTTKEISIWCLFVTRARQQTNNNSFCNLCRPNKQSPCYAQCVLRGKRLSASSYGKATPWNSDAWNSDASGPAEHQPVHLSSGNDFGTLLVFFPAQSLYSLYTVPAQSLHVILHITPH